MRTAKYVLTALMALFLVVAGAYLPYAAAEYQDRQTEKELHTAEMEPLELQIRELTLKEKTQMLGSGESTIVNVSGEGAHLSAEMLPEVIAAELVPYQDAAVIHPDIDVLENEDYSLQCQSMLCYDDVNGQSFLLWGVSIEAKAYGMYLGLDDATGAILVIEFWTAKPFYSENVLYDVLFRLYTIYFARLGMAEEVLDFFEFEPVQDDKGAVTVGWLYENVAYHFTAYPESFSITLN